MLAPVSDDDKKRFERFGRKVLARMVLSAAGAVGAKVGEIIVDSLFGGRDDDENGDGDDDDGDDKP